MDKMSKVHTAFNTPKYPEETTPTEPDKNLLSERRTAATETVEHNIGSDAKKNIKSVTTQSGFSKTLGNSPNPNTSSSSTTATTGHTTTTNATILNSTTQTLSSSTTTAIKSNATQIFTPRFHTPFTSRVQDSFYNSLSRKALGLVEKYRLTKEEAVAIHAYSKNKYYDNMNEALRAVNKDGRVDPSSADALWEAGIKDPELATLIAAAVQGMKKLPPTQTSESHFFALGRNDSIPDEFLKPFKEGASVTIPSFFSTTVSSTVVEQWWDNKDQALCIFQRVQGNGRDITEFSEYPSEKEVLFIPGTQFMVLALTEPTITPSGINNSSATKVKRLMHLQEVSTHFPLPPSVNTFTFGEAPVSIKNLNYRSEAQTDVSNLPRALIEASDQAQETEGQREADRADGARVN